ncbi:glycosyltransferase [Flavobacteriales bacterium]|nr:glycosyltransferase [Flavobacteriales bacterium]
MRIANVVLNDFTRDNRVLKVSATLSTEGHDVTVVALHKPGLPKRERQADSFDVRRIRLVMPTRVFRGALKLVELAIKIALGYRRFDAWHCNDAEAFVIGLLAKLSRPGLRLIYDCHEFESERNGKSRRYLRAVGWLERRFIRFADEVIVVSPSIADAYMERYHSHGLDGVQLLRNVPHKIDAGTVKVGTPGNGKLRQAFGLGSNDFIALYQGAFTINRGIEELLAMTGNLKGSRIHLVFMGYGMLQGAIEEAASSSANVHFQPAVPYEEMLQYTKDADVGLVSVRPICLSYLYCLPNKLFECIQAGVPVLVNDLPDCVALIRMYGIGRVVEGDEPQAWLEALMAMEGETPSFKAQVQDGLARAQSQLNWEREQHVLMDVYAR